MIMKKEGASTTLSTTWKISYAEQFAVIRYGGDYDLEDLEYLSEL